MTFNTSAWFQRKLRDQTKATYVCKIWFALKMKQYDSERSNKLVSFTNQVPIKMSPGARCDYYGIIMYTTFITLDKSVFQTNFFPTENVCHNNILI